MDFAQYKHYFVLMDAYCKWPEVFVWVQIRLGLTQWKYCRTFSALVGFLGFWLVTMDPNLPVMKLPHLC